MADVTDDLSAETETTATESETTTSELTDTVPTETDTTTTVELTASQRARIERNRQRALLLRQSRLQSHPYATDAHGNRVKGPPREVDTGAGFFIEETEVKQSQHLEVVHPEAPVLEVDNIFCNDCQKEFMDSFLYTKFDEAICDTCRSGEDNKYPLITRTEAKKRFLLKDEDFDKREPELKFLLKRNPHNERWGNMKLYLESQVKARAMEVWGSEENMEDSRQQRTENKEKSKQKKFDKKVKELRMSVRSSLLRKEKGPHEHEFDVEKYDEDEDMYSKTCKTCAHTMTYEKM